MSCLRVFNVRVLSLSIDYNQITWEVEDTTKDVLDYTFQVLKSESATGPFEPASVEFEDRYRFIDNRVKAGNIYRQYHYVIRVKEKSSGETEDFGPFAKAPEPTLIATELRKHMSLLMREFIGRRCWLLPVRTFGQRCPDCWNQRLKKRVKSGCRPCYDTGFIRGYLTPVELWVSLDPQPSNNQETHLGRLQQQNTTGRTAHFPPMKPGDIVVEPENVRWRITQRATTQEQRAIVTQELQLHRIPETDIEYSISLDVGAPLEDLFYTPSRQYSNPQHLDVDHPREFDYPQVFQLYDSFYPPVKT